LNIPYSPNPVNEVLRWNDSQSFVHLSFHSLFKFFICVSTEFENGSVF
jgi:hypothetical protein